MGIFDFRFGNRNEVFMKALLDAEKAEKGFCLRLKHEERSMSNNYAH